MATFSGGILPRQEQLKRPTDQQIIRERRDFVKDPQSWMDTAGVWNFGGPFTNMLPVTLIKKSYQGGVLRSFFDDYYNRLYFLPSSINLGAISTTVTKDFRVWNSYRKTVQLTDVVLTNGEGLSLSGVNVPDEFLPLGLKTYSVVASTSGPPDVDATFTFTFDAPETFNLHVTGTRAKVSPLLPNWSNAYTVEYAYKTDMFVSRSGREQRRALRTTPRKKIGFNATPHGPAFRALNDLMASWHNNTIILPEIPRQVVLAQPLMPGDPIAVLYSDAPDWAVPGATVVLSSKGNYETRRVDSVLDNTIVFTSAGATMWPVGTKAHPGVSGRIKAELSSTRQTNNVATVDFEMDVTPASEPVIPIPAAPAMFNGRELFTVKPNWIGLPDVTYISQRETLDYDRGLISIFNPVPFVSQTRKLTFTSRDYVGMKKLTDFFDRMKGQRGEFYMPTWEADIDVGKSSPVGSRTIRINGTEFAKNYPADTVHKAVAVYFKDGTVEYKTVQSIFEVNDADGNDSVIQVGQDWTRIVSPDTVRTISWLLVFRHASDTLTVEWLTNSVAQCEMTMRSLEDLPV
ncbi:MAG: hypothetical protein DI533_20275 [Cereibacter sphaeroides]|uniref:Virion structural protein n=1 Tax=Cereibacter sphaeroides TaxID=1063 RepID=A0A2W5UB40_CERSP|nr:MAG: hypothetical protein DI533_20275 [Cereibacter sphaeroides]